MRNRPSFEGKSDHDLLLSIAESHWDLKEQLCDNGQPGRCSLHAMRLAKLEYFKAWAKGALAALSVVLMGFLTVAGLVFARK